MRDIKINLNDSIKVVLTKVGADRLNERYNTKKHFDRELYETQLWVLMSEFGDLISLGCWGDTLPFSPTMYFNLEVK